MSMTLEFWVDWDAVDWRLVPSFSGDDDISSYVMAYRVVRGHETDLGNIPSGTMELTLNNSDGTFSVANSGGDYYGRIRPWLPVQMRAIVGATTYTVYSGFISRLTCYAHRNRQTAVLYCTDGMDLLARNGVVQDETGRSEQSDGAALGTLLDAAGWPTDRRSIDTSGGSITRYPTTVEY